METRRTFLGLAAASALPIMRDTQTSTAPAAATTGSARTDGPTRALVFMVVPKGSPLTAPE